MILFVTTVALDTLLSASDRLSRLDAIAVVDSYRFHFLLLVCVVGNVSYGAKRSNASHYNFFAAFIR